MNHKHRIGAAAAALAISATASAAWTAGDLDSLTQAFVSNVSTSYATSQYPWQLLSCDADAASCFGTNPDSPYGAPNFSPGTGNGKVTRLKPTDALVLVMETPPAMRYFGVTPYLFTRYYPTAIPHNPATPGFIPVFESLGDTVNLNVIGTTGSATPGTNPFQQLAVFVMAADKATAGDVASHFAAVGFPAQAVNRLVLPVDPAKLKMGSAATSDTYTALLRVAYPANAALLADYIQRAPVRVLTLSAITPRAIDTLPPPVSRTPGNGVSEAQNLASARDLLAAQLKARFGTDYTLAENTITPKQTVNYACITLGIPCNGDNADAIYTQDAASFVPASQQDRILIVGVNHVATGKATYLSHSVVAASNNRGVEGTSDAWLAGTGLVMGNVSGPGDPRYATYSQLYAFTAAYDCAGDPVCVTIPDTADGVPYGQPVTITGRIYLDPHTNTRPSTDEIVLHRAFVLTRK